MDEIGDVCVPQLMGENTDVVKPILRTWCRAAQWSKIVRLTQEEIVLNLRAIQQERVQQRTAARVPVITQREVPVAQMEQTTVDCSTGRSILQYFNRCKRQQCRRPRKPRRSHRSNFQTRLSTTPFAVQHQAPMVQKVADDTRRATVAVHLMTWITSRSRHRGRCTWLREPGNTVEFSQVAQECAEDGQNTGGAVR